MTAPRWALALLRRVAPPGRGEDLLGDLEEAHGARVKKQGRVKGSLLTCLEALDVAAALIRARVRQHRSTRRSTRSPATRTRGGPEVPTFSRLDVKLAFRMLVKYPGLTLVGGLAIAFAIAVGAGIFEFVTQAVYPTLPLPEGDRIIAIRNWDAVAGRAKRRSLYDFVIWREELESVEDMGARRTIERNLITGDGRGEPVTISEISASAFRLTRVPPRLGRTLVEADEQVGAQPVVVIGHDVWQTRFSGDLEVVGQRVRLGSEWSTIVGVMPEDFAFPVFHNMWVPLRLDVLDYERGEGPAIRIFGRLAPGRTLAETQAEVSAIGARAANDFPDTHEHLHPEVIPYARSIVDLSTMESAGLLSINVFVALFLVLVCGNVALLMFARAATRESEIVVRNALGASRGRIIMQLFAEALALGGVGAVVGLIAAGVGLRWAIAVLEASEGANGLPFWFNNGLAPTTVLYVVLLTVLGAVIAGVMPALKVTRGVEARLRQTVLGGSALRLGGLWTAVIIAQVAVTVASPVTAFFVRRDVVQIRSFEVGFPTQEYLSVRLEMDRQTSSGAPTDATPAEFAARFGATNQELKRRLTSEPGVAGVSFVDSLPHTSHRQVRLEVDDGGSEQPEAAPEHRASTATVDIDYFDVLGAPLLAGRGFHLGDLEPGPGVVIVNQTFVREILGERNAIGRRIRIRRSENPSLAWSGDEGPGPWHEIVGVVKDLGMTHGGDPSISGAGFYHPLVPGAVYPVHLAVHLQGDPEAFTPSLRRVATAVDPTLRLYELKPLDEIHQTTLEEYALWFRLTVLVSSVGVLLSLAGIYSVMSFTVSRRTREIGIRVALGSDPRHIFATIFARPLTHVGLGVVAGGSLVAALTFIMLGDGMWPRGIAAVVAYAACMMGVCMLACIVPTRRALRVEPTEALRTEG